MVKYEYIAKRLRELRKERKLTPDALGSMVERSGKTIEAYETGTSQPNADMLIDLCKALKVDITEFVPREERFYYAIVDIDAGQERELLEAFRALDERGRADLVEIAKVLARRQ